MFDRLYQQTDDRTKLAFLDIAFQKFPHLKEEFLDFYHQPAQHLQLTIEDPEDFIMAIKDVVKDDLEAVDLMNPDWEDYVPRHSGYIPEYMAMSHMAENQLSAIIGVYTHEAEGFCSDKKFDLAFLQIIGIHDACTEARLEDDLEVLPDANDTLLQLFEAHLQEMLPMLKAIEVPQNQLYTIATLLFAHGQMYYPDDSAFLQFFEPYLHPIIYSGTAANMVMDLAKEKNAEEHMPWLMTELHQMCGGPNSWEQAARQAFTKDEQVANDLLDYYKKEDKQEFIHIARELWRKNLFHYKFAPLYFETLQPDDDPDLYLQVAVFLNNWQFSEKYYHVIQQLMPGEQRLAYMEKFRWNPYSYTKALCMEGKPFEALAFANDRADRYNLPDLVDACIEAEPAGTIAWMEIKINELLETERGRNFYRRMARALTTAAQITQYRKQVEEIANNLLKKFNRMSALKDELRQAGFDQ